jgi:hypothetical protein
MSVGVIYVCLLALGVAYALFAGALGWLSDLGGGDVHLDASGHLEAGQFHPVSGTTIATFITGFGGGGIVAHYVLHWPLVPGLAVAVVCGLALAAAAFGVLELIFKHTQAGAEYVVSEVIGREAEVITPIPAHGTGEVAYLARGQRERAAARSADGASIARGPVIVEKVMGQTIYVRPKE